MEHVKIGAERAGKNWQEVEVVNRAMVLATDDKAGGRDLFRAAFAPYYATPVYNKFLAWAGYDAAAATITEGQFRASVVRPSGEVKADSIPSHIS